MVKKSYIKSNIKIWSARREVRRAHLKRLLKQKPSKKRNDRIKSARHRFNVANNKVKYYKNLIHKLYPPTLGERAWHIAGTLVGVVEQGGNNNGPAVARIIKANGGVVGEPWCGDFVAYCYRIAGSKAVTRAWAAVRSFLGYIGGVRRIPVSRAKLGDPVVYKFDHVGMFGYFCDSLGRKVPYSHATHIFAREGNTGSVGAVSDSKSGKDGVKEKIRPLSQVEAIVRVYR